MNIVSLFFQLNGDLKNINHLGENEIFQIEKKIKLEKKINPDAIDSTTALNLIHVLKNYKTSFFVICNTRILFNFLTGDYHLRTLFADQIDANDYNYDEIHFVIEEYLLEDLKNILRKKLADYEFDDIKDLLEHKDILPFSFLAFVKVKLIEKINLIINRYKNGSALDKDLQSLYDSRMYLTLNYFTSPETDEVMQEIISVTAGFFNLNNFHRKNKMIMQCMVNYNSFSPHVSQVINENAKISSKEIKTESSGFSWRYIWLAIILVRAFYQCSKY